MLSGVFLLLILKSEESNSHVIKKNNNRKQAVKKKRRLKSFLSCINLHNVWEPGFLFFIPFTVHTQLLHRGFYASCTYFHVEVTSVIYIMGHDKCTFTSETVTIFLVLSAEGC